MCGALGQVLDKVRDFLVLPVLPGRCAAPVVIETPLDDSHLLPHRILGIFLHAAVQGGVDGEAIGIEVEPVLRVISRYEPLRAHLVDVVHQLLTEVRREPVITALRGVADEHRGQGLDGVKLGLRGPLPVDGHVPVGIHQVKHRVAACQAVGGVDAGVVAAGGLEQSHKHRRLLVGQPVGRSPEIGAGGRLDTIGVAAEVNRVEVHGEYLLLAEYHFQLDCHYPLLGLHHQQSHSGDMPQQPSRVLRAHAEQVLGQLLGDGAGPARVSPGHVLDGGEKPCEVHTVMMIEPLVLGVDKRVYEHGGYLTVLHGRAVLAEIATEQHAVGTVYLGGLAHHRFFNVGKTRRVAEKPEKIAVHRSQA